MRVIAVLFGTMTSWAQIEQGSFVGIVLDPQKAPVAGAAVTFRRLTTNVQREELTKSGGDYNSPPLQAGRYAVTVKHAGFRELRSKSRSASASVYNSTSPWNSAP